MADSAMNGLQRYRAMLEGRVPDILPRAPLLMQFATEYIGSDYAAFAADHRVLTAANVACAEAFGIDQLSCISDPYRETQGFGGTISYFPDGPPRCDPPLAASKDLDRLPRPEPWHCERMRDRLQAVQWYQEQHGGRYSIMGWVEGPAAEAADLRGVTRLLMDLMDDEPYAAELMDHCLDLAIRFATAQVAAGADTIGIGDAIASQLSPELYRRLVLPREARLVEAVHAAGGFVRLHICGNITHLLPAIAELGVDVLDVDHLVDPARVRAAVGAEVTVSANLDPVRFLRNGTAAAISAELDRVYALTGPPFLISAGCEVPSGTPEANLRALCAPRAVQPESLPPASWHGAS